MRARELINSASFGPDDLRVIAQAFDTAWASIAVRYGSDPQEIDAARVALAKAVLACATEGIRDVDALKAAALKALVH